MANSPDPVFVEFATRGIDETLKALQTIEEKILGIERRSAAVQRLATTSGKNAHDAAIKTASTTAVHASIVSTAARRSGNDAVARRAEQQYRDFSRHVETLKNNSANLAGRYAAQEARKGASARLMLEHEQRRAQLQIMSGKPDTFAHVGPKARLDLLSSVKGKPHEEIAAAVAKSKDMALEERALVARERKATRVTEQEEKRRADIRTRSALYVGRLAEKQTKDEAKARIDAEEEIAERRRQYAKTIYGAGGTALRNATHVVGRAGQMIADLAPGGGFSVEDSLRREVSFRGRAAQIATTTQSGVTQEQLMKGAREVGIANGIDPEEVLKGYEAVKKLDDSSLPIAVRTMPKIAKIAAATGTDMGQLGELAANITASNPEFYNAKNVSDAEKDARLTSQLRIFSNQGVKGGVEIDDFAKYGARLTASASLFGGDREKAEADLGAAAQIARQRGGASSPAEATLAAQQFATDLQKKDKALKALGIDVADKNGSLRPLEDVTLDMLHKESSVTGISEFKIGERGNRYLTGVADLYRNAGGGAAGDKAVHDYFKGMSEGTSEQEIDARAAKRNAEVDKQLEIAFTQLRVEVGTKLVPVLPPLIASLTRLTPELARLLDGVARVASWAAENPFAGFGALVTGFFVKELAAAQISTTVQGGIMRLLGGAGGGGGGPMPGAGTGAAGGGTGSSLATGLGLGAVAGAVAYATVRPGVDAVLAGQEEGQVQAGALTAQIKNGNDEDRADAYRQLAGMQNESGGAKGLGRMFVDASMLGPSAVYSAVTGERNRAADDLQKTVAAREVLADPTLIALMKQQADTLNKLLSSTQANAPAPPPRQMTGFSRGPAPLGSPRRPEGGAG